MSSIGPRPKSLGTETVTFRVYEAPLNDSQAQIMVSDPVAFFTQAVTDLGFPINALCIDDRYVGGVAIANVRTPSVWHIEAPPERKSTTVIIEVL